MELGWRVVRTILFVCLFVSRQSHANSCIEKYNLGIQFRPLLLFAMLHQTKSRQLYSANADGSCLSDLSSSFLFVRTDTTILTNSRKCEVSCFCFVFFFIFDGTLLFPSVFNCSLTSRLGSVSSGDQTEVVHVSFQWCINGQCVFDTAAPSVERMSPPFITPPPSSTDIPPLSLSVCLLDCVHHRN